MCYTNSSHKKVIVVIMISHKIDFKTKKYRWRERGVFHNDERVSRPGRYKIIDIYTHT